MPYIDDSCRSHGAAKLSGRPHIRKKPAKKPRRSLLSGDATEKSEKNFSGVHRLILSAQSYRNLSKERLTEPGEVGLAHASSCKTRSQELYIFWTVSGCDGQ
jgi:hypothetical protein